MHVVDVSLVMRSTREVIAQREEAEAPIVIGQAAQQRQQMGLVLSTDRADVSHRSVAQRDMRFQFGSDYGGDGHRGADASMRCSTYRRMVACFSESRAMVSSRSG